VVKRPKYSVLVLVDKDLVPPNVPAVEVEDDWQMEWDIVTTLRRRGHTPLALGVHDDLAPIRLAIEEFKPDVVFNLLEAFHGVGVFDQNVVSYLELLKMPYTGCNPRGLTLARDKALARKLLAYHRIPFPDFAVVPLRRRPALPRRLRFPLIVKSLTFEASIELERPVG
jgi:D-alanine-D-alanine ligase